MAYALRKGSKNTRWVNVKVPEYGDNDQLLGTLEFKAELEKTPVDQWSNEIEDAKITGVLRSKIKNIADVKNEDGTSAAFSEALVEAVLADQAIVNVLWGLLIVVQAGEKESNFYKQLKLKN